MNTIYLIRPTLQRTLLLLISILLLGSCSKNEEEGLSDEGATVGGTVVIDEGEYTSGTREGSTETGADEEDLIANSTFDKLVSIQFNGSVSVSNPYSDQGVEISYSGENVVVKSTIANVEYTLSGTTSNGSVKIYSDKKFKLTLDGVSITHVDGPAINIQSSKRVFVNLPENSISTLVDGSSYAEVAGEDMKAALFSEGQLIFGGKGTLQVQGNYKHGICSDDYVRITDGIIDVTTAVTDGIHANDAVIIDGGTVSVKAGSDGIEADEGFVIVNDGNITLDVVDDGLVASYEEDDASIDPYVVINGGTINITTSEGEGIESKSVLTINNGTITTNTKDDGLNASDAIYINGGTVYSRSTGNDAMDSNGTFTITGGKVFAVGSTGPEAGFDCDARTFKITGGLVLGVGGATSAPTANVSTVYSVVMGSGSANQVVHIEDESGNEVLTFLSPTSFNTLLFGSTKVKANTKYYVYTGGSVSDGTDWNGLYTTGTYTRGSSAGSFTTSSVLTQTGGSISRN